MKKILLFVACGSCFAGALVAQEEWQEVLRQMPLSTATSLNRDNCLPLLLGAFQSNGVVKGLVFLPAVSDDFYLISRDRPKLNIKSDNLLAAITALTNATAVRITFKPPILLLHFDRDVLEPTLAINHQPTAETLKQRCSLPHTMWIDRHWERLQPQLEQALKMKMLPDAPSVDAWHFARHNLVAWNLSDWDLLVALSLTGKTTISIQKNRVVFRLRDNP